MQQALKKVKTVHDPQITRMGTDKMRSIVEVELNNGQVISRMADTARGTPEKPLRETDLHEKFEECATFVLDEERVDLLFKTIQRIEEIPDIGQLTSELMR